LGEEGPWTIGHSLGMDITGRKMPTCPAHSSQRPSALGIGPECQQRIENKQQGI